MKNPVKNYSISPCVKLKLRKGNQFSLTSGVTESKSFDGPEPRFGLNVKFVGPCEKKSKILKLIFKWPFFCKI